MVRRKSEYIRFARAKRQAPSSFRCALLRVTFCLFGERKRGRTALIVSENGDSLLSKPRERMIVTTDVLYEAMDEKESRNDGGASGRRPKFGVKLSVGRSGEVGGGHGADCEERGQHRLLNGLGQ